MIRQHGGELILVFGLEQVFHGARGQFANAASVGAKAVHGPCPFNASTSPEACTAAISVLEEPAEAATSTMSLSIDAAFAKPPIPTVNANTVNTVLKALIFSSFYFFMNLRLRTSATAVP